MRLIIFLMCVAFAIAHTYQGDCLINAYDAIFAPTLSVCDNSTGTLHLRKVAVTKVGALYPIYRLNRLAKYGDLLREFVQDGSYNQSDDIRNWDCSETDLEACMTNIGSTTAGRYRCFKRYNACCSGKCLDHTVDLVDGCPTFSTCPGHDELRNQITCLCETGRQRPITVPQPVCTFASSRSTDCERSCSNNTGSLTCGGETLFCDFLSANTNKTCVTTPQCTCRMVRMFPAISIESTNGTATFSGLRNLPYRRNFISHLGAHPGGRTLLSVEDEIFLSCGKTEIDVISSLTDLNANVVLHKHPWSKMYLYSGGNLKITLPSEARVTTGELKVDLYVNATLIKTETCSIVGEKLCIMRDCLLCADSFSNWNCVTPLYKTLIIVILLLLFLLAIVAIPVVVYFLYMVMWLLILPFRCCFFVIKGFTNSKFAQDSKKAVKSATSIKQYFFSPVGAPDDGVVKMAIVIFAFGLMMVPAKAQCGSGSVVTSKMVNCVTSGGYKVCEGSITQITAAIVGAGSAMCLTVVDEQSNVVGTITVSYLTQSEVIATDFLYASAVFEGVYEDTIDCPPFGVFHWHTGIDCTQNCPDVFVSDPTGAGEITDSTVYTSPGQTFCRRTGGGLVDTTCISTASLCVYSAYGLVYNSTLSSPSIGNVYALGQRTNTPLIELTFTDAAGNVTTVQTTLGSGPVTVSNFTFTGVGSFSDTPTEFENDKLIVGIDNNENYLGAANDVNQLVSGAVGDIQTNDYNSFYTPSRTSFQYAPDIATRIQNSASDNYTFVSSGFAKVSNYITFPLLLNGRNWLVSGSTIYANTNSSSVAIEFTLETSQNLTFWRSVDLICPSFEIINATGCYQCLVGFEIWIMAYSKCKAGSATVTMSGAQLSTHSVPLTTIPTAIMIQGTTQTATNSVTLVLNANGGNDTDTISFTATAVDQVQITNQSFGYQYATIGNNNNTLTANVGAFFSNIGTFFARVFTGVGSWWEYLVFGFFALIVLIGFAYLLPVIVPIVSGAVSSAKKGVSLIRNKLRRAKVKDEDLPLQPINQTNGEPSAANINGYANNYGMRPGTVTIETLRRRGLIK